MQVIRWFVLKCIFHWSGCWYLVKDDSLMNPYSGLFRCSDSLLVCTLIYDATKYLLFFKMQVLHTHITWCAQDIQRNPSELIDITNRLLVKNPSKRLGSGQSYREIRMHPYFSKVDFGNLHTLTHLCEVPSFREAFASNEKAVIADKPVLEISKYLS